MKSAPNPPDYTAAAEATAESNAEAINMQNYANRINQYNPWGSLTYDTESMIDPATGQEVTRWTQNQEFSPIVQSALNNQLEINDKKSQFASQMMDRAGNVLLQDTDYRDFTNYGAIPSAFDMQGNRKVNTRPMYQSPAPVSSETAGWYTPRMTPMQNNPPPQQPPVDGQMPPDPVYTEPAPYSDGSDVYQEEPTYDSVYNGGGGDMPVIRPVSNEY